MRTENQRPVQKKATRPGTQKWRVGRRLVFDYPHWTSTSAIHRPDDGPAIIQAGTRIFELEHDHGILVDNRMRRVDGVVHSEYRLAKPPSPELLKSITAGLPIIGEVAPPAANETPDCTVATRPLFDGLQSAADYAPPFPDEVSRDERLRQRRGEGWAHA